MNIYLDIETIPEQSETEAKAEIAKIILAPKAMKKAETIQAWHDGEGKYAGEKEKAIDESYRKTSFDGGRGQVCSIAWAFGDNDVEVAYQDESTTEADVLRAFFAAVHLAEKSNSPFFIVHYLAGFDLKFLFHRSIVLGINPEFKLPFDGRHNQHYFCTMMAWCGYGNRVSQDNLCKALGIDGKGEMDGSMVWDAFKAGEFKKIADYNILDVETVRSVYKKLNYIK